MSPPGPPPPERKCAACLAALLVGVLLLAVFSNRVATVIRKVSSGAGMDYCCTIEGVPFNYIALFVLLCGIAVALLLGLLLQVREWRSRRDFEHKYGVKLPASKSDFSSSAGGNPGPSLHGVEFDDAD